MLPRPLVLVLPIALGAAAGGVEVIPLTTGAAIRLSRTVQQEGSATGRAQGRTNPSAGLSTRFHDTQASASTMGAKMNIFSTPAGARAGCRHSGPSSRSGRKERPAPPPGRMSRQSTSSTSRFLDISSRSRAASSSAACSVAGPDRRTRPPRTQGRGFELQIRNLRLGDRRSCTPNHISTSAVKSPETSVQYQGPKNVDQTRCQQVRRIPEP